MIRIRNASQMSLRAIPIVRTLDVIRTAAGYSDWNIGVCLVTERAVKRLNTTYRGQQKPTDILSFAHHQLPAPEQFPTLLDAHDRDLGDLFVCPRIIADDAKAAGVELQAHWQRILIHGFVHLLGYDHETDAQFAVMQHKEDELLRAVT